ncbi:MAG: hypothetical protein JJ863_09505 [Deltaproteobacteria bacterium]|nr:hypothetical protein [Deltaproteobacteria bacterium]
MALLRPSLALVLLVGCVEAELVGERDGGTPDAGMRDQGPIDAAGMCLSGPAPPDGIAAGGETCALARPPSEPIGCDDSTENVDPIMVALKDPVFGDRMRGVDFDGYCSGAEGQPNGCTPNEDYDAPDPMGGIDNIFGVALWEGILIIDSSIGDRAAAALEQGELNVMLRIEGWSGEPRDPRVEVTLGVAAATVPSPPLWDGADVFQPAESFFQEGDPTRPIARDDNAYVADGILVAQLPDRIPLGFDTGDRQLELKLTQPRITMSLLGPTAFTDAVVTGRWAQSEARAAAPLLGLCADSTDPVIVAQRNAYMSAIDRFADIRESSSDTDPTLPCDALSFAIGLRAYDVTWGDPTPLVSSPPLCP